MFENQISNFDRVNIKNIPQYELTLKSKSLGECFTDSFRSHYAKLFCLRGVVLIDINLTAEEHKSLSTYLHGPIRYRPRFPEGYSLVSTREDLASKDRTADNSKRLTHMDGQKNNPRRRVSSLYYIERGANLVLIDIQAIYHNLIMFHPEEEVELLFTPGLILYHDQATKDSTKVFNTPILRRVIDKGQQRVIVNFNEDFFYPENLIYVDPKIKPIFEKLLFCTNDPKYFNVIYNFPGLMVNFCAGSMPHFRYQIPEGSTHTVRVIAHDCLNPDLNYGFPDKLNN